MSRSLRDRGFALVAALWAVMILATMAYGVMLITRSDARLAVWRRQVAELTAIADAGINLVLVELLQPASQLHAPLDGRQSEISFADHDVQVRVQDQSGLVDLNYASTDLLRSVLSGLGLSDSLAQSLADSVADWRDASPGKRLNGAKQDDYHAANLPYGPRGGPFPSVDEARLVLGMTPDLFERLRPMLTVTSQSPTVDLDSAPASLLPLLPGMDADSAAAVIKKRGGQNDGEEEPRSPLLEVGSLTGHALEISAEVHGPNGLSVTRTATVRLTGHSGDPIWSYSWR